ncbi:MAG: prohibitin family protein [Ruminococcaceae bacterium]|nr:prohibitin family protein [Oscillospiraceae bacterium]
MVFAVYEFFNYSLIDRHILKGWNFIMKKNVVKIVIAAICVVLVAGVCLTCFTVVKAGHTGVVLTFGAVEENVFDEGLHFKMPLVQTVVQMNNRTQKVETEGSASSKDLQIISYVVAVNYHVRSEASASLYQNVGKDYGTVIIVPAIQESIKAVTAQFTAEELITKRQTVGDQIKEALSEKINSYGIEVEIFNIVNFDFSEEFNAAVEAKQTAQQQALKAEQDLVRVEVEAKQKIAQAEAEAESIRLIQEALAKSPDYVDYVKWNKWDGKLPEVMGSDGVLVDVGDLDE